MGNPRQSSTVYVETVGVELCLYDWRRGRVHALNPTAALVWRQCNGAITVEEMAAELRRQLDVPEADAVVRLTLRRLAHAHLLDESPDPPANREGQTRRALLRRSVATALLPAISTIAVPTPLAAQSLGVPTLTGISPLSGTTGSTVDVTLTGTGFGTTVQVSGTGVTASILTETPTSLVARVVIAANATPGPRNVTVTTAGGTSSPLTFTINPGVPTLTAVSPAKGVRGTTVPVTITGSNFVSGSTTITGTPAPGAGDPIIAQNVVVSSSTSLTANLVVPATHGTLAQPLTVTTPAGTSGPIQFLVTRDIPTLTSIVPATGAPGTTVAVTLTGTEFYLPPDSLVGVAGGGITVQNLVGVSRLTLTAAFVIAATATVGPRSVTVTTPAGTSGAVTFTVI